MSPISPRIEYVGGDYKPLPYQQVFHQSKARLRAVVGGLGCGKTHMGAREALKMSQLFPGSLGLIGRLTAKALEDTTQRKFFEICPPQLIKKWNETKGHLWLRTGIPGVYSEILFRHLDEPGPLGSLDLDWFWIDEAHEPEGGEVPEKTWMMLQGRIQRGHMGPYRGWVTTNSGGEDWVYRWFFDEEGTRNPLEFEGWTVCSEDNPYLPEGYVDRLKNFPPEWVERFLHASFKAFEGQIYVQLDEKIHVIDRSQLPEGWQFWPPEAGFDYGVAAPTAIAYARISPDNRVYIVDEFYESESNITKVVAHMRVRGYRDLWADPSVRQRSVSESSDGQLIKLSVSDHFAKRGVRLNPANNDVIDGITAVIQALIPDHIGKPRLYICRNCVQLLKSIKNYRWKPNKPGQETIEKPRLVNVHGADAIRYLVVSQPLYQKARAFVPRRNPVIQPQVWEVDNIHPSYFEDKDAEDNPELKAYLGGY